MRQSFGGGDLPPLFWELERQYQKHQHQKIAPTTLNQSHRLLQQLRSLSFSERQEHLQDYIQAQIAQVSGLQPDQIDPHTSLLNLGLDSLMAIEFRNRLINELGIELPIAVLIEGANIVDLASQMSQQIQANIFQANISAPTEMILPNLSSSQATEVAETQAPETQAPETQAPETQAIETQANWIEGVL